VKSNIPAAFIVCFTLLATASFAQYNIADKGAAGDGKTLNTKAIQSVIDA
jgi:polygalacturonase